MRVDIGNALASEASPGVPEATLDRLDERVAEAHRRIERGREESEFGYAALDLPETVDVDAIERVTGGFDPTAVLLVGIGGSALGAATISAMAGPADAPLYVLDNIDPEHTARLLDDLPLAETVVNVVSRSGSTPETLANFLLVREAMADAGVEWTERTIITTGSSGPLAALGDRESLPVLNVPEGVPGRFSALSTVGLVPIALQGHDVGPVLDGAREAAGTLTGSLFDCPAYAYGAVSHALEYRGATTTAIMPYGEALVPFGEWFAQLWAESLGKDGLGQTPARARGATDQHSQLQLYRAGRHDRLVTLVRPRSRRDLDLPETDVSAFEYLSGIDLGDLLDIEFEATEASLAAAFQPNVRVEIESLDGRSAGELLYGFEAACVLAGELSGVDVFTQPAVDWGKRATRGMLGEGDFQEAAAVSAKRELLVE